ncbi:four helix bundle protein [bacterium]|nr:four helix bundle protein [bacterium]
MNRPQHIKSFKELNVYQKAFELSKVIFEITKTFPKEESYSLTDQIRRSSRSIGAQIAEAWAKRRYERHFISKLTDADAEQMETRHWMHIACSCGYIREEVFQSLVTELDSIGRMLHTMIKKSGTFCGVSAPDD